MKHVFMLLIVCSFISLVNAQGVYKTADDYENNLLAHNDGVQKVHADIIFNPSGVKVKEDGETYTYLKDELYGFRDKKNRDYRFFEHRNYRIVDARFFPIYSRVENIVNGKAKTRETRYYFSTDTESTIVPLTLRNLKQAFPRNREFHELLDLHFDSNKELLKYDSFYGEYKLKAIYHKTIE